MVRPRRNRRDIGHALAYRAARAFYVIDACLGAECDDQRPFTRPTPLSAFDAANALNGLLRDSPFSGLSPSSPAAGAERPRPARVPCPPEAGFEIVGQGQGPPSPYSKNESGPLQTAGQMFTMPH